jgi:HEAT repeat protein
MKQIVLGLVILALVASTGFAHGGAYRGPAGEVPPNMRKPEDPPPPSEGGTPTPPPEEDPGTPTPGDNPGPGRPAPVPPPGSDPDAGAGPVAPKAPGAGNGGGGATTGNPRNNKGGPPPTTFDIWAFWWGYNKDDILNLKARIKAGEQGSATGGGLLDVGSVHGRGTGSKQRLTDSKIQTEVIPALEKVLKDPKMNFDIRAGAVIALGKIGASQPDFAGEIAKILIDIMNNKSGNEHFSVEESGALALGLLQLKDKENIVLNALCDKALDRRGSTKNQRTRAFACLALGLLQVNENDGKEIYERVNTTLRDIVKSPKESLDDMAVCALMGMGLSGNPEFADELLAIVKEGRAYKTKKVKDLVQCYAASAIGKIAESNSSVASRDTVEVLKKAMISAGSNTVRSAVIAFGQIGSQENVDTKLVAGMVHSLEYIVKKGETQASNFGLISLGKIGGAVEDRKLRNRIYDTLRTAMKKGNYTSKPFAAIALGLMGRTPVNAENRDIFREAVRFEFKEFKGDPKNRGAYALALGMLEDQKASADLIKVLEDRQAVKSLRGSCAIALGLIRDRGAAKAIKSALEEPEDRDLRVDTAIAAGLLNDSDTIPTLARILEDKKSSLFVQGSVSLALGRIGDHRAVDPLVKMLEDENVQDLNRALAAVALGLLGDRRDLPVLSRLAKDVNYRAQINAMEEVLSIL